MPVAFIADTHIANHRKFGGAYVSSMNERCRQVLKAISLVDQHTNNAPCVILGDVFDTARPIAQIVAATAKVLPHTTALLIGNHDQQTTDDGDHALAPLGCLEAVDCPERPNALYFEGGLVLMVPYRPGQASEWLPGAVDELMATPQVNGRRQHPRALCIHLGVYTAAWRPPWAANAHDAVSVDLLGSIMDKHDIKACFAGNWHTRKTFKTSSGRPVIQAGSLAPTGWDDAGLRGHGVTIWEPKTNEITFKEIPGPRFVDWSGEDKELGLLAKIAQKQPIYVRARVRTRDEAYALKERIEGLGMYFEPKYDQKVAQIEARNAANAARSAESREDALSEFVTHMPLDEKVDRDAVLTRCKGYLGGAIET